MAQDSSYRLQMLLFAIGRAARQRHHAPLSITTMNHRQQVHVLHNCHVFTKPSNNTPGCMFVHHESAEETWILDVNPLTIVWYSSSTSETTPLKLGGPWQSFGTSTCVILPVLVTSSDDDH